MKYNNKKREYDIEYRKKHPEKFATYRKTHQEKIKLDPIRMEKRRIKMRKYVATYKQKHSEKIAIKRKQRQLKRRFLILEKYNFTCQYCGRKPPQVELQVDHKLPKSKGGDSKEKNLTVACKECNIGKSDILLKSIISS